MCESDWLGTDRKERFWVDLETQVHKSSVILPKKFGDMFLKASIGFGTSNSHFHGASFSLQIFRTCFQVHAMFSQACVVLSTIGLMATCSLFILVTAWSVRILLECFLVENMFQEILSN